MGTVVRVTQYVLQVFLNGLNKVRPLWLFDLPFIPKSLLLFKIKYNKIIIIKKTFLLSQKATKEGSECLRLETPGSSFFCNACIGRLRANTGVNYIYIFTLKNISKLCLLGCLLLDLTYVEIIVKERKREKLKLWWHIIMAYQRYFKTPQLVKPFWFYSYNFQKHWNPQWLSDLCW